MPNKPTPQPLANEVKRSTPPVSVSKSSTSDKSIDPVVARLKEKRRLEREQAEAAKTKQNRDKSSKSNLTTKQARATTSTNSIQRPRQSTTKVRTTEPNWDQPPPVPAKKKLTFNDLMKKANQIDHDKLSIKFPQKSMSPEPTSPKSFPKKSTTVTRKPFTNTKVSNEPLNDKIATDKSKPIQKRPDLSVQKSLPRVPMPVRQPNAKIQERLKQKQLRSKQDRGYGYGEDDDDDDDDLSDFLVSDEEEDVVEERYNRDEIWAMFNKGKKRKYYEYNDYEDDDDDMEATGADVLEEELKSRLDAEREDRREMEEEKRRALENKEERCSAKNISVGINSICSEHL